MMMGVNTKSLERGEDNKDGGPTVIKRKGEMDKQLVSHVLWRVVLLDDVIDVLEATEGYIYEVKTDKTYGHCGANKECHDECCNELRISISARRPAVHTYDVTVASPEIDVDSIKNSQKGETPRNTINDYRFSGREELVDNSSKKEDVDQRPKSIMIVRERKKGKLETSYQMRKAQGAGVR